MGELAGYNDCYVRLPDRTIKMMDPLGKIGITVRVNTERARRLPHKEGAEPIVSDYRCRFCPDNEYQTPPEKGRMNFRHGEYNVLRRLDPDTALYDHAWDFRRIPNLFEIITYGNWTQNYQYKPTDRNAAWKKDYLSSKTGRAHLLGGDIDGRPVMGVLRAKLGDSIDRLSDAEKELMLDPFFFGTHELIIGKRHYKDGAAFKSDLASSGELTPKEHRAYIRFTTDAIDDIYTQNRFVKFVNVFQNWLAQAGASAEHLHKQLVGNDEYGGTIQDYMEMVKQEPHVFNINGVNLHAHHNLVIAENEHAIAYAAIGKINPAVVVFSKSKKVTPMTMDQKELEGFSDVLHACHAAMGSKLPCNEEWFYTPRDACYKIPVHVQLDWRVSVPAGMEYISRIYITLLGPEDVKEKLVPTLIELKESGNISPSVIIGDECPAEANCLKYV